MSATGVEIEASYLRVGHALLQHQDFRLALSDALAAAAEGASDPGHLQGIQDADVELARAGIAGPAESRICGSVMIDSQDAKVLAKVAAFAQLLAGQSEQGAIWVAEAVAGAGLTEGDTPRDSQVFLRDMHEAYSQVSRGAAGAAHQQAMRRWMGHDTSGSITESLRRHAITSRQGRQASGPPGPVLSPRAQRMAEVQTRVTPVANSILAISRTRFNASLRDFFPHADKNYAYDLIFGIASGYEPTQRNILAHADLSSELILYNKDFPIAANIEIDAEIEIPLRKGAVINVLVKSLPRDPLERLFESIYFQGIFEQMDLLAQDSPQISKAIQRLASKRGPLIKGKLGLMDLSLQDIQDARLIAMHVAIRHETPWNETSLAALETLYSFRQSSENGKENAPNLERVKLTYHANMNRNRRELFEARNQLDLQKTRIVQALQTFAERHLPAETISEESLVLLAEELVQLGAHTESEIDILWAIRAGEARFVKAFERRGLGSLFEKVQVELQAKLEYGPRVRKTKRRYQSVRH